MGVISKVANGVKGPVSFLALLGHDILQHEVGMNEPTGGARRERERGEEKCA